MLLHELGKTRGSIRCLHLFLISSLGFRRHKTVFSWLLLTFFLYRWHFEIRAKEAPFYIYNCRDRLGPGGRYQHLKFSSGLAIHNIIFWMVNYFWQSFGQQQKKCSPSLTYPVVAFLETSVYLKIMHKIDFCIYIDR